MTHHRRTGYRRTVLVPLLAAALLTITSCASTVAGDAQAATDVSTSSETSSTETEVTEPETTDPADAQSEKPIETDSPENTTTEPVPPVAPSTDTDSGANDGDGESGDDPSWDDGPSDAGDLDEASRTWIRTLCTGFADVVQYAGPGTTGMTKEETISTVVDAYRLMSGAAGSADKKLAAAPPPTFPQHDAVVRAIQSWFETLTTAYGQGSQTIADGTYSEPRDLTAAIDDVEAQVAPINDELSAAIGEIDPSVTAALVDMPECEVLVKAAR